MVKLPATAAIEYVAAWNENDNDNENENENCPVGLLPGGTFVRGAYARSPKINAYTNRLGFLCPVS